jgi:hypothetical protein
MKKSILIAGSVLSLFILVSISYQPIKADTPIVKINCNAPPDYLIFIIGKIYNVKYFVIVDSYDRYEFQCKNTIVIYYDENGDYYIQNMRDGQKFYFSYYVHKFGYSHYRGFIGEEFICAYMIVYYDDSFPTLQFI